MPNTTKTTMNGRTLCFEEESHTYTDDRNMQYDSVTTMLGHYHKEFDAEATAERMEKQGKGGKAELIAMWDRISAEACDYGTKVHQCIEDILSGRPVSVKPENDKERSAMRRAWDFYRGPEFEDVKTIKCEALLFHPEWHIAGTSDYLGRLPDGTILIGDHKTNKDIHKPAFQDQRMKDPVSHLPDCSLSHYALQLNIYQALIVSAGYVPRDTRFERRLYWIPPHEGEIERIDLPDMQKEAYQVILDWIFARVPF